MSRMKNNVIFFDGNGIENMLKEIKGENPILSNVEPADIQTDRQVIEENDKKADSQKQDDEQPRLMKSKAKSKSYKFSCYCCL